MDIQPPRLYRALIGSGRVVTQLPIYLLIITAASIGVIEWYPLSSFPMYSRLSTRTHYVHLTGLDHEPIAAELELGSRTAFIKRAYRRKKFQLKAESPGMNRETRQVLAAEWRG